MNAAADAEAAKIKKAVDDALTAAEEVAVAKAVAVAAAKDAERELATKNAFPDMSHLNHWGC
jgi:hypothetical protein